MHRIQDTTNASVMPPASVSGSPGYFTEGNNADIQSTRVTATWANAVQEEIAHVVEQADITLDVYDNTQLYLAIVELINRKAEPTGTVKMFAGSVVPSGFLICDGSAVSRTTYSALYAVIGNTYGGGNGATTFNLPDLRASFVRGYDGGRAIDTGRVFGSTQAPTVLAHTHTANTTSSGAHAHTGTSGAGGSHTHTATTGINSVGHYHTGVTGGENQSHTHGSRYDWRSPSGIDYENGGLNGGNEIGGAGGNWTYATTTESAAHTHNFTTGYNSANHTHAVTVAAATTHTHTVTIDSGGAHTHPVTVTSTGGDGSPRNVAMYYIIKT